ncbi:SRPBCC family protein [Sinosporangium siamense]|uniref:Activator of Hsp90 ATPase homologue 1/2-like C-terminal domain-containing protein n=1 Tax=Sinosporangium siamense TaxID=1367973 RepID=A0A919RE75_9ACTN|nr:SRPBCC domain-containing protein [Sinosporangium siamense]GII92233.1 hypothetical protein Ssi02_24640 [Sinosporangium siamense]
MSEQRPFTVEQVVAAPREEVWRALTELDQVAEWFGWDHPGFQGEIQFIFADYAKTSAPERIEWDNGQDITLEADGDRTVVRVTMAGPADDSSWEDFYDGLREGWRSFFEQLRFWVERRPTGRRRTLFLTGELVPAAAVATAEESGVREVWHRSHFQHQFVDDEGHLIVVNAQVPLTSQDEAQVGITITTYGLTDADFASLRARWETRWSTAARNHEVTV